MSKKDKKKEPAKHAHSWKAVRFVPFTAQQHAGMFGSGPSVEITGTRVGFECEGCPERAFKDTTMSEEDARWVSRANEAVPDAFVSAFEENSR